jgi:hypothetical protein
VKLETAKITETNQSTVLNEEQQEAVKDAEFVLDLNLKTVDDDQKVSFDGGKATIKVPFTKPDPNKNYAVFYIDNDGISHKVEDSKCEGGYMTFTAEHFSVYATREVASVSDTANTDNTEPAATEPADTETAPSLTEKHFDDKTKAAAKVSDIDGRRFTVTCARACVVAYTTDDGATYTRLTGDGSGNSRTFTLENDVDLSDVKISVALKGDLDLNGSLSGTDAYNIRLAAAGLGDSLTALAKLAADVDENGKLTGAEAYDVRLAAAGLYYFEW